MAGKAIVQISAEYLLGFFEKDKNVAAYTVIHDGIPPDAKLLGISIDHSKMPPVVELIIEAESLPQGRHGNLLPRLVPVLSSRLLVGTE